MRFLPLALCLVVAGHPALAQLEPEEAESRIREACKAEAGTDPAKCDCYVGELKSVLPSDTYEPMMALAAAVMSEDMALLQEVLSDGGIDAGQLNEMVLEMQQALGAAEQRCEAQVIE